MPRTQSSRTQSSSAQSPRTLPDTSPILRVALPSPLRRLFDYLPGAAVPAGGWQAGDAYKRQALDSTMPVRGPPAATPAACWCKRSTPTTPT
ncbi:hypothetical protein [Vreelandella massiliensis]|uniref:hypothetical protein n=1 Tax=Vreelandella massiliensis TaxID=1816686 RepID=UPI001181B4D1|nr:hypothetical protein [Halomonas massiliensis]